MNILEVAKQGDAEAIEAILNHYLKPKGITAKTDVYKSCLQVSLESTQLPEKQVLVTFVYKTICDLKPEFIHKVRVCGRSTDLGYTVWVQEFEPGLQADPELAFFLLDNHQKLLSDFKSLSLNTIIKRKAEFECRESHSIQLSINKTNEVCNAILSTVVLFSISGIMFSSCQHQPSTSSASSFQECYEKASKAYADSTLETEGNHRVSISDINRYSNDLKTIRDRCQ